MKVRQVYTDQTSRNVVYAGSRGTIDFTALTAMLIFECKYQVNEGDDFVYSELTYTLFAEVKGREFIDKEGDNVISTFMLTPYQNVWSFIWGDEEQGETAIYRVTNFDEIELLEGKQPDHFGSFHSFEVIGLPKIFIFNDAQFVDANGNLTYNRDDAVSYVDKIEAVRQWLIQHLSIMKKDLWYNYAYGLPLGQKGITKAMIDSEVLSIVVSNPDIVNIETFNSTVVEHDYVLNMSVQTKYGRLDISNTL